MLCINVLVPIKYIMVASSMLALFILSWFSLLNKRISVNWTLFKSKTLGSICLTVFKISLTEFKTLVLISAAYRIMLIRFWHLFCILAHQAWQTWFIFNTIRLNRVNALFVPSILWIVFRKWKSFSVSLSTDLSQSVAGIEFLFSDKYTSTISSKRTFQQARALRSLFQYPCRCICH